MKKISLFLICLWAMLQATAQYGTFQNAIWAFGKHAGVSFTSGMPIAFTSSINTDAGCASICNTSGSLLFYTDGRTVYNRLGTVMPYGSAIVPFPTGGTTQGALIVPFIGNSNRYYVFSLEQGFGGSGRLAYSIVDMTLDGGLGDILPGSAGTIINTGMSEKMISIRGNGCNIWLVAHKDDTTEFYAYEITASGISSTPVISNVGTFIGANCYTAGTIKCSPNRQKIASICSRGSTSSATMWGLELFDFNPATGIVSNCRVLESSPPVYYISSVEFSPDNSKLYGIFGPVYQWDISLPTTAAIVASKTTIAPSLIPTPFGDMKLGPNGKMYISKWNGNFLDCVNSPNTAGAACGYVANAVNLLPTNYGQTGLPNLTWATPSIEGHMTICPGTTTSLTSSIGGGIWSSSNTGVATISPTGVVTAVAPGTSVISYIAGSSCDPVTTINVVTTPTLTSTSICVGNNTPLVASTGTGTWMSASTSIATVGATTGIVTGIAAGTAIISFNSPGCSPATTVVTVNTPAVTATVPVCAGTTDTLSGAIPGGAWSSSNAAVATVGTASGIVTAITAGTAIISYIKGVQCPEIFNVIVIPLPSPITGSTTVSTGSSITLTNTAPGDTWSSSDTTKAKVNASGKVTGVAVGTVTIYYTLPTGCKVSVVVTVVKNTTVTTMAIPPKPTLYPNPAANEIIIVAEPPAFKILSIYNAVGQEVMKSEITSLEMKVDIKTFPPGQYQVIFTGEGTREMLRFVKW